MTSRACHVSYLRLETTEKRCRLLRGVCIHLTANKLFVRFVFGVIFLDLGFYWGFYEMGM